MDYLIPINNLIHYDSFKTKMVVKGLPKPTFAA
jgi:hypothetical protein